MDKITANKLIIRHTVQLKQQTFKKNACVLFLHLAETSKMFLVNIKEGRTVAECSCILDNIRTRPESIKLT